MKNDDWQELLNELRGVDVELPRHQKALRDRLLTMHPYQPGSQAAVKTKFVPVRISAAHKRVLLAGVFLLTVGALMLGLLVLLPNASSPQIKRRIAHTTNAQGRQAGSTEVAQTDDTYDGLSSSPQRNTQRSSGVQTVAADMQPVANESAVQPDTPAATVPTDDADLPVAVEPVDRPLVTASVDLSDKDDPVSIGVGNGQNKRERAGVHPGQAHGLALGLLRAPPFN